MGIRWLDIFVILIISCWVEGRGDSSFTSCQRSGIITGYSRVGSRPDLFFRGPNKSINLHFLCVLNCRLRNSLVFCERKSQRAIRSWKRVSNGSDREHLALGHKKGENCQKHMKIQICWANRGELCSLRFFLKSAFEQKSKERMSKRANSQT